ncbi:hypothetical protein F4780DRAFT_737200 [Xylariomycetidae sp. FL0641]|nr:hypothetical protein F4780DRAFT_737200 [Xylariomycetidae sp. FL0641]
MTRALPWKRRAQQQSDAIEPAQSTPTKEEDATSDSEGGKPAASPVYRRKPQNSVKRNGSTSPNAEPPRERYMINGIHGDDRYRMVEDEFLATAQQFTAHMHAAEYHRLKGAAKSDNAETISDISRPVVFPMTSSVADKKARGELSAKQKAAVRSMAEGQSRNDGNDDTEVYARENSSLTGLMETPSQKEVRLSDFLARTGATRAAAGFSKTRMPPPDKTAQSSSNTEVDTSRLRVRNQSEATSDEARSSLKSQDRVTTPHPLNLESSTHHRSTTTQSTALLGACTSDRESSASSDDAGQDFLDRLHRQQKERKQEREQQRQRQR